MRHIIAHKKKWDEEGVVSTVGTIMGLLIFLTFLSLIVNSYVPVWMKDDESSHMNVAYGQFGDFKESIDSQILYARMSELAGVHYTPSTVFTPITMGIGGVPIFSSATLGLLTVDQAKAPWNAWFGYYPNKIVNIKQIVNETAGGYARLDVYNRYFVPQTLAYENGGVMKAQTDGMVLRAEPTFDIAFVNNTEDITMVMITMLGYGSIQGSTTEGVHAKVISVSTDVYRRIWTDVSLNHTTPFGLAWWGYYNKTLSDLFGVTPDRYSGYVTCVPDNPSDPAYPGYCYTQQNVAAYGRIPRMIRSPFFKIDLTLDQTSLDFRIVVTFKNDSTNIYPRMMPINTLTIMKVVVNTAVGGIGSLVDI
jgi:hypothetical protein